MSNGILFNHESEVRGPEFVTRKISQAVARINNSSKDPIILGNLDAVKDWGYAMDYVDGMWKMLQTDYPDDFVLGTGEAHTVREFAEQAFEVIGIKIEWKGTGVNEIGIDQNGRTVVKVGKTFFRPLESDNYVADYTKSKEKLGWGPKTKFKELVRLMVESDIAKL